MPSPLPAQPPSAAPVVPGYVLEDLLGRGGTGQVWRARPRAGGDPVALKVLVRGDAERQEREAALLAELAHPHLVRLREVVRREVRSGPAEVTLVLDLLAGGSLAALLARRGRLRPGEVVTTVAPVAAALAHAHDRGVVHGDLSPGNVVFTDDGRPVLTDLGTARVVGDAARVEVTPAYVDPVVARGSAPEPASDVFGIAAAAFHALTGIAPWNAAGPESTLEVAARGELPDLALLAPEAPAQLVAVVRRGLSADPGQRGTAAAFARDVRRACRAEPVRLPAPGSSDGLLGTDGRTAGSVLTHQAPGRRRPTRQHAAPPEPTRGERLRALLPGGGGEPVTGRVRRLAVGVSAAVLVVAALVTAAWVGTRWGSGHAPTVPVAQTAPAVPGAAEVATTDAPSVPSTPASTPPPAEATVPPPAEGSVTPPAQPTAAPTAPPTAPPTAAPTAPPAALPAAQPSDPAGWTELVGRLYERRGTAFCTVDTAALAEVYAPDSPMLDRDREQIDRLRADGRLLAGFAPRVVRVETVTRQGPDAVALELVDAVPGYQVVPAAAAAGEAQQVAGRGEAAVRMVLTRSADGWRISSATLAG